MPGWHRSLRLVAPLVARAPGTWPYRAIDAAAYVKPYVKRQKNGMADAEAICEAGTRANMRFVPTKDTRAAELPDASPHSPSLHPPADRGD